MDNTISTFLEWSEEQRSRANPEREELAKTGTTEHIKKVTGKLTNMVDALIKGVQDEVIPPCEYGHERITAMPYRTPDECGWSIEMCGTRRDEAQLTVSRFGQEVKLLMYEDRDQFEAAFKEAREKNFYVELADEPHRLRMGFLVCNGNGVFWHSIRRSSYKKPTAEVSPCLENQRDELGHPKFRGR